MSEINEAELYMKRCLQLASTALGFVAPNPLVGAVVVHEGKIIGEGYHRKFGEAHAEPNAINSVKDKSLLSKSTLFVSLEPCSHFGHTPPCANLIVSMNIPKVVIGTLDPNPKVAGRGVRILEEAGIDVTVGVLTKECRELNKRFFTYQEKHRPYIILKWAQTQDGFLDKFRIDKEELPLRISNALTTQLTHKMRAENQSILVSTNTVVMDNPSLTVRNWPGKSPIRIALDRTGRIPSNYTILNNQSRTLIFTESDNQNSDKTEFIKVDFAQEGLKKIVEEIYKRNINSILVEGGAKLHESFINLGLWDEAHIEISKQEIGNGIKAPYIGGTLKSHEIFDDHDILTYLNSKTQ